MSNAIVTKQMMDVIDAAKKTLREAKRDFEKAHREIRNMSYQRIDLFGGKAVSQVADIVSATKMASESKYVACQTLVAGVDEMCRPLLSQDPDLSAVEAVSAFLKLLNDESKIENSFDVRLNGSDAGDFANIRYYPSIENQKIERFWLDKYNSWPGKKEKDYAEEEHFHDMEQRIKAENAERLEQYNTACLRWKKECERIDCEVDTKLKTLRVEFKNKLIKNIEEKFETKKAALLAEKQENENAINAQTKELGELGFFAFGKKGKLSQSIKKCRERLAIIEREISKEEREYKNALERADAETETYEKKSYNSLKRDVTYPEEPAKPSSRMVVKKVAYEYDFSDRVKNEILSEIEYEKKTVAEILRDGNFNEYFTNQNATYALKELISKGAVIKIETDRKCYYLSTEHIKWKDGYAVINLD